MLKYLRASASTLGLEAGRLRLSTTLGGHKSGPDILEKPLPGFESRLPGQEPSHNTD